MSGLEFYDAVRNGDLTRLKTYVDRHRVDLNARFTEVRKKTHLDLSPIHLATYKGYTSMLQYMLNMKCDVHLRTGTLRRTALHFAVLRRKMACLHRLLSVGADADARDTFGNSACHYAAEDGDCTILDVLIANNIDVNAQDITWKTPLMKATRNGKVAAVRRLIRGGCCLNLQDKNLDTALHFAARNGRCDIVTVLINSGAEVDVPNQWGRTPLIEAVCYNNKDAVARLVEAGCDVNWKENETGDTALHISIRRNYTEIVEILLLSGKLQHTYNTQGEASTYDLVHSKKVDKSDILKHLMYYNYDLELPVKMEPSGLRKSLAELAFEKEHLQICKPLVYMGHIFRSVCGGSGVFFDAATLVPSLKQLCRKSIRKALGWSILEKSKDLPLPVPIKDYVLMKEWYNNEL